jgi:hypothetical protein
MVVVGGGVPFITFIKKRNANRKVGVFFKKKD